jgi:hypothetical protein
MKYMAR